MLVTQSEPYNYDKQFLHTAYRALLLPRLIEEKMLLMLRYGRISKWFSGIGEEAISVGATLALEPDDYICTLHRNLGVFTTRGVPLRRLFAQFQGTESGFTKGRDRTFHFGTNEHHIVGMISHLGPQLAIADGLALAAQLSSSNKVALAFTGEGGTSEGDFHEALNVAAVWNLPVIFVVVNNGYALSTPTSEQYRCQRLADRASGYGMEGYTIDGNNLLQVYETVAHISEKLRQEPAPVLLECLTFRMRGHEEASGTKYVPAELMAEWAKKDPIACFETELESRNLLTQADKDQIRQELQAHIDERVEEGFAEAALKANTVTEVADVFAEIDDAAKAPTGNCQKMRFVDAIRSALDLGLESFPELILMGQDIAEYGGVFKATEGLLKKYGHKRVKNTPLCESAIVGLALGLSIEGYKSMVEMQFSDFVTCGFNQIVNNLAKTHYRWGQNADVVIRMPCGGGVQAGPFHSQSSEAWFMHCPGLKIAYPAFPEDAKGLLLRAFEDPNPVIFFEHKKLYRSAEGQVPEGYYSIEFGKARTVRGGEQVSIITYGLGVHWALEILDKNPQIDCDLIDLRTLAPLDYSAIRSSVQKTGRVLVLHEANLTAGVGAEIAAYISEHCFNFLDAPVVRCASLDTPIPFVKGLEDNYLALSRLEEKLQELLKI